MALYLPKNQELCCVHQVFIQKKRTKCIHALILKGLNPGQDEIDEMIEETDRDNSGAIDFR